MTFKPNQLEYLEPRRLLSSASLSRGLLTVDASDTGSQINISIDPANARLLSVNIDGAVQTFPLAKTRRILVNGGPGNDSIQIDDSNGPIRTPATLYGGDGNDTLIGGAGPELLDGGNGDDVLNAGTGNQTLQGDAGDDTLTGGPGHDLLEGGDDDDLLTAGSGPNQLYGDAGNDTLYGGSGSDTLGGASEDTLYTAGTLPQTAYVAGNDSIVCGSGNDWVVGDDNEQLHQTCTIIAGTGKDILDGRDGDQIINAKPGDIVPVNDEYANPTADQTTFAVETLAVLNIYIRVNGKLQKVNIADGIGDFDDRGMFYTSVTPVIVSNPGGTLLRMRDLVNRPFYLSEFFQNWGLSFSSTNLGRNLVGNGHQLLMFVNGKRNYQFGNYKLQSKSVLLSNGSHLNTKVDHITIIYT